MERLAEKLEDDLKELIPCIGEVQQERIDRAISRLKTYEEAEEQGLLVRPTERLALAMCAGARAIENNRRYKSATYVYDVFGVGKELSYREAARLLREEAEKALEETNRNG